MGVKFDLVYMDSNKRDQGILQDFSFDLAYGEDENDFELKVNAKDHVCGVAYMPYIEGTEYGGRIDAIKSDTAAGTVTYIGRTWHGILEGKVITPDPGQDYYTVSGEANTIIGNVITRLGLTGLFTASGDDSGITVSSYKFDRYIKGYSGLKKMLKKAGAKLITTFENGMVTLSAEPITDYSQTDEFDSDQVAMVIKKIYQGTNHLICLGSGELSGRTVVDLYVEEDGTIGTTQYFFGMDEITDVLDYPNAESTEELTKKGVEQLTKAAGKGELSVKFDATQNFDIGDIIEAKDIVTGISVKETVSKKIVSIQSEEIKVSYNIKEV